MLCWCRCCFAVLVLLLGIVLVVLVFVVIVGVGVVCWCGLLCRVGVSLVVSSGCCVLLVGSYDIEFVFLVRTVGTVETVFRCIYRVYVPTQSSAFCRVVRGRVAIASKL